MGGNIERIINVTGVCLVLGIALRWGPEMARLIAATGNATTGFVKAVSLQDIQSPTQAAGYQQYTGA